MKWLCQCPPLTFENLTTASIQLHDGRQYECRHFNGNDLIVGDLKTEWGSKQKEQLVIKWPMCE